jgi:hypothetical protein
MTTQYSTSGQDPLDPATYAGTGDLSHGIEELAGLISFRVGAWHDLGYENPPAPGCATVPPLGERSAEAVRAGHAAVEAIDELTRQLHALRGQLIGELRQDEDLRAGPRGYCTTCGGNAGHFIGYDGPRHYRGEGTAASPVELFTPDDGHEPAVAWRYPDETV